VSTSGSDPLSADELSVGDWFDTWLDTRRFKVAPSTMRSNLSLYRLYFSDLEPLPLSRLTPGAIKDWLAMVEHRCREQQPGRGQPHTVRHCHALLAAALRDAVDHELLDASPMARVPRPRVPSPRPKHMAADDVRRLLRVVDETGDPRGIAVVLMAHLGLRRNEALGLTWGDVDVERQIVRVRAQISRVPDSTRSTGATTLARRELKTVSSRRDLRLTEELVRRLRSVRAHGFADGQDHHLLVSLDAGRPVDPDAFTRWLTALGRSSGISVSPHRLRHTAATLMLNRGASIEAVAKVLGHGDVRVTSVYAKVLDETSAAAIEVLGSVLVGPDEEASLAG